MENSQALQVPQSLGLRAAVSLWGWTKSIASRNLGNADTTYSGTGPPEHVHAGLILGNLKLGFLKIHLSTVAF